MTFVTAGLAVAGLCAVAIPIIIHLLARQRRRPVEWAAMRFLIEAFRKHKRRLQIEQLVLLAVRCLIVAILGLALARPLLESTGVLDGNDGRVVLLVIDNGLASGIGNTSDETALRRHVEDAIKVVQALGPTEAVGVVTMARPAASVVLPASLDHSGVVEVLESIEANEAPTDISAALYTVADATRQIEADGGSVVVYLFSDFRAGSAGLDAPLPRLFDSEDSSVTLVAAPPATQTQVNVQVVGIDPVRRVILPGANDGSRQVTVRLERHGGELGLGSSRVRLVGDGIGLNEPRMVDWQRGQSTASVTFTIDFDASFGKELGLTAVVDAADTLQADNQRFVTLEVRRQVRVAMISQRSFERVGLIEHLSPGQWMRRALEIGDGTGIEVVDVLPSSVNEVDLRIVDAVIVAGADQLSDIGWRALRSFVDQGGLVIFTPPAEVNVHRWTDRLASDLGLPWRVGLEVQDMATPKLLADDQPASELLRLLHNELSDLTRTLTASRILPVDPTETQADSILVFEDGTPMMIAGAPRVDSQTDAAVKPMDRGVSGGLVVYLAVAPRTDWSNLPIHTFMVPLFQETIRQGLNLIRAQQQVTVGEQPGIAGLGRGVIELVGPNGASVAVDGQRRPTQSLDGAGVYRARDASGQEVALVAVNLDVRAGRTDVQSSAEVGAWLEESGNWTTFDPSDPAAILAEAEAGASIAGTLLVALLVLVLVETILARRFSHAFRGGSASAIVGGLRGTVVEARA